MAQEKDVSHLRSPEVVRQVAQDLEMSRARYAHRHAFLIRGYVIFAAAVLLASLISVPLGFVGLSAFLSVAGYLGIGLFILMLGGLELEKILYRS